VSHERTGGRLRTGVMCVNGEWWFEVSSSHFAQGAHVEDIEFQ